MVNEEALVMPILFHLQYNHTVLLVSCRPRQKQALTGHLKWEVKMDTSYLNN